MMFLRHCVSITNPHKALNKKQFDCKCKEKTLRSQSDKITKECSSAYSIDVRITWYSGSTGCRVQRTGWQGSRQPTQSGPALDCDWEEQRLSETMPTSKQTQTKHIWTYISSPFVNVTDANSQFKLLLVPAASFTDEQLLNSNINLLSTSMSPDDTEWLAVQRSRITHPNERVLGVSYGGKGAEVEDKGELGFLQR